MQQWTNVPVLTNPLWLGPSLTDISSSGEISGQWIDVPDQDVSVECGCSSGPTSAPQETQVTPAPGATDNNGLVSAAPFSASQGPQEIAATPAPGESGEGYLFSPAPSDGSSVQRDIMTTSFPSASGDDSLVSAAPSRGTNDLGTSAPPTSSDATQVPSTDASLASGSPTASSKYFALEKTCIVAASITILLIV